MNGIRATWRSYRMQLASDWNKCRWPFGKVLIFPVCLFAWTMVAAAALLMADIPELLRDSGFWGRWFWKDEEKNR